MTRPLVICSLLVGLCLSLPAVSPAQTPNDQDSKDRSLNVVQPDFTVVNLPTTLRLPRMKSAFRVTHRFGKSLTGGTFGQAAESFFGIDNGAQIGLEYRFGIMRGLQAGIYRTSDKTIEFFNVVLEEDTLFGRWIQKSQESYGFKSVPLSYQEARIYHWNQWADRLIGIDKIPPELRVPQVIGEEWLYPSDPRLAEAGARMAAE